MANEPHVGLLLRLIAIFKVVKALVLLASLATLFDLIQQDDPTHTFITWALRLHVDPDARYLRYVLAAILDLDVKQLELIVTGVGLYVTVFLLEGVGLWFDKLWAEYLTIIATGSFVPVELYEALRQPGIHRDVLLALNVAIVIYLIVHLQLRRTGSVHVTARGSR
jgi:uncharacterized membrane protein (DUF2068 family)